jgi:predicted amidohydrolase
MAVSVAVVQLGIDTTESVPARIERTIGLIREAADGSDLVILPELWTIGAFMTDHLMEHAQPLGGPLVTDLGALAGELGIWLHAGSFPEVANGGEWFNTSVLFAPTGALVAHYRKIHLFGFNEGEITVLSGGDELVVVDTPLGATGLATCYDLRFPELFRALVEGGATSVLLTSGWPQSRIEQWRILVQARAIEDQVWVIACNQVGQQGDVTLGGHSLVVDPSGTIIADAGTTPGIMRAVIEPDLVQHWRESFPVLPDIRLR